MVSHELAAEFKRVFPGRARHLLDEALQVHAVLVGVDAAPRSDRHVGVAHRVLDLQVGHGVAELRVAGLFPKALELANILAFLDRARIQPGVDRLPGNADVHTEELAALVQPRGELALRDRPVEVVRLILLAAPDQFDGYAGELLRDGDRLARVVLRAAAPAESASEVELVYFARGERQSRFLAGRGERAFGALRRRPYFDLVRSDYGRAVHRLHGRVREEGRAVDRFDFFRSAGDRLERIADLGVGESVVGSQAFLQALGDGRARLRGVRAFVPDDGQGLERGLRPPPGVGNDCDRPVVHLDRAAHAGHLRDLGLVEAHQLAAVHRAGLDRGAQHARQLEIDRIDLAAVQLVGRVQALHGLAGDLPVLRVLELDALRIGGCEVRRRDGDPAVGRAALGSGVRDDAVGDGELACRNLPLLRRRLHEHHARRSAAAAHIVLRAADAAAAAGRHVSPDALAGEVLPGKDVLGRDLLPVALELLGDELREAGERALPHLRARDADHAGTVGPDDDP